MVKIIDYRARQSKDGEEFFALIISGGIEMVKSRQTGRYYATSKKASVTSTFDEETCRELIGEKIPGSVQKVECEPYEFTIKETGEITTLSHRWVYLKEGETIEEKVIADKEVAMPL
jgi:hypothetical protein